MDIALIEAHDARVEAVTLHMDGSCEVRFKHLAVYESLGGDRFAVWSFRAVLELNAVTRLQVEESSSRSDYVSDAIVRNASEEVPWLRLLEAQAVVGLAMVFGSGRRIDVDCGLARIVLQNPVRQLEEWNGPLGGQEV